jgi:hypothetical protein
MFFIEKSGASFQVPSDPDESTVFPIEQELLLEPLHLQEPLRSSDQSRRIVDPRVVARPKTVSVLVRDSDAQLVPADSQQGDAAELGRLRGDRPAGLERTFFTNRQHAPSSR